MRGPLPQADAVFFDRVSPGGCPSFYQVGSCAFALGSSSLGLVCVGGFKRWLLLCIPSGCGHPLGQQCLFVTLDRERRFTWVVVPFRCCQPFLGSRRRLHRSSFGFSDLRYYLAGRLSLTVGCLLLASSAA